MPRVGDVYERPAGIDAVEDETISSGKYNLNVADVETDLNTARPILSGGTGATNATQARDNLDAEVAAQVVTNYDSHIWEIGSFYSALGATSPPAGGSPATRRFAGFVYGMIDTGTPANTRLVMEARDLDDTAVPGVVYVREKIGTAAWSAWAIDQSGAFVEIAGDKMTGDLEIEKVIPQLILDRTDAQRATIVGQRGGLARWDIDFGNGDAEGGTADGSNFVIHRFNNAGAFIGNALSINRATAAADFPGSVSMGNITVNGTTTLTGAVISDVNIGKVSPILYLSKTASGQAASVIGRSVANAQRWTMEFGSVDAEDGVAANAGGSSFILHRYRNDGGYLGQALNINRATGAFALDLTIAKAQPTLVLNETGGSQPMIVAQKAGSTRWTIYPASGPPSDFVLGSHNDAGAATAFPFQIARATSYALFSGAIEAVGCYMGRFGVGGAASGYVFNFGWVTPANQFSAWVQATNIGNVAFTSDYRTKDNVLDLPSMWDTVKALRPISYTIKDWMPPWELEAQTKKAAERGLDAIEPFVTKDNRPQWGFIAHELQATTIETAATGHKDAEGLIQSPNPWTVIAALTKVVQELIARVEALEATP